MDVPYDLAPYAAVAQAQREVERQVLALVTSERMRPGLIAARLNSAGIKAPNGSTWDWLTVRDLIDRAVLAGGGDCGAFHLHLPHGGCVARVGRGGWGRPWG